MTMKNFIEKIKELFSAPRRLHSDAMNSTIQVIRSKKQILAKLAQSKESGNVIGIYSQGLGQGMFLTSIEDLFTVEKENIIVLKPYDLHGIYLQRTHLSLAEIDSVCPFNIVYANPIKKLNEILCS
jgi:hypothetical protein